MKPAPRVSQSSTPPPSSAFPRPKSALAGAAWPDTPNALAAIVEHSNDAIFSRTLNSIVTTWNAAAERIFGHTADGIIGRSSRVLLPPGQRDEFRQLLDRIRRGEVIRHFETERRHRDGRLIQVSLTLSPVRDAQKRLAGFSTIARDTTEERRTIDLLARREHELQDLFDEASVGLVMLALDGTILRANRAFFDLLERAPEQVIGQALSKFHPHPATIENMVGRLAARQTFHNVATELCGHDGRTGHVLVDANTLWADGCFVHSRWFVRDISQRKRLERELLELSDRERRGFAQELHDGLGQQLGGVAYLSNVLREKLAERNAPETGDATRIFGLVREAIEQTRRVSRGLSPIRPEPDGLMTALHELAAQTKELFRVRCRFLCRPPVRIEDASLAGHLYRIAQEAVNNAIKHAGPRSISIRLRHRRDLVTLFVADDGKGIGAVSPRRQGLGLHIMQYRASLVRGTVTVRPRPVGGTEVICTAPGVSPPAPARKK